MRRQRHDDDRTDREIQEALLEREQHHLAERVFRVGAAVRLRSGSLSVGWPMIVGRIDSDNYALCFWHNEYGGPESASYPTRILEVIEETF